MKVDFREIIIRPYRQEDAQDLANTYYNTIFESNGRIGCFFLSS